MKQSCSIESWLSSLMVQAWIGIDARDEPWIVKRGPDHLRKRYIHDLRTAKGPDHCRRVVCSLLAEGLGIPKPDDGYVSGADAITRLHAWVENRRNGWEHARDLALLAATSSASKKPKKLLTLPDPDDSIPADA